MFLYVATALIATRTTRFYPVILFAVLSQLSIVYLQSKTSAGVSEDFIIKIFITVAIGGAVFGYKSYLFTKSSDRFMDFKRKSAFILVLLLCLLGAFNAVIICLGIKNGQTYLADKPQRIEPTNSVDSTLFPVKETKEETGFGIAPDPMLVNSESGKPTLAAKRAQERLDSSQEGR